MSSEAVLERVAIDPDTQLMIGVQADDARSFSRLLDRNRNVVVQFLARMVRNHTVAEDLAQEVFLRVYRSRASWKPDARFSTWLYRITTNVALNHLRDEKHLRSDRSLDAHEPGYAPWSVPDRAPLIEQELVRDSVAAQVRRAIRTLPAKQRAAVIMHKYHELDYNVISQVLGCTPSAVKAMMFRAYETLRLRLSHLSQSA